MDDTACPTSSLLSLHCVLWNSKDFSWVLTTCPRVTKIRTPWATCLWWTSASVWRHLNTVAKWTHPHLVNFPLFLFIPIHLNPSPYCPSQPYLPKMSRHAVGLCVTWMNNNYLSRREDMPQWALSTADLPGAGQAGSERRNPQFCRSATQPWECNKQSLSCARAWDQMSLMLGFPVRY